MDRIPNSRFPLLIHRNVIPGGGTEAVKARFRDNGWSNNWEYPGVYHYAHFHSTSHECLGCADIMMCGGYAGGRDWDNIQEAFLTDALYYQACKNIMALPIPDRDPATGKIMDAWHDAPSSVDGGWNDWRDGLDAAS